MLEYASMRGISFLESEGIPDPASLLYFDNLAKQDIDYVLVSIDNSSYSDHGINSLVNIPESINVILKVDYLEGLSDISRLHKITMSHSIDVLLFDTEDDPEQFKAGIKEALEYIPDWALRMSGFSYEKLGKWLSVIEECLGVGYSPRFIFAPINPNHYPLELLEYCKENDIRVVSDSPYGNRYERESMFEIYTQEFLDRFSMIWSDLVLFPCTSFYRLLSTLKSTKEYRGKEVEEDYSKVFKYSKSVDRKILRDPKRIVHSYNTSSSGNCLANYSDFNINSSVGFVKNEEKLDLGSRVFEEEVSSFKIPKNAPDSVKMNYLKAYIVPFLDSISSKSWKKHITSTSNYIYVEFRFKFNWLSKFFKTIHFIACIVNGEPCLFRVQNAPEITLKSYS